MLLSWLLGRILPGSRRGGTLVRRGVVLPKRAYVGLRSDRMRVARMTGDGIMVDSAAPHQEEQSATKEAYCSSVIFEYPTGLSLQQQQ